MELNEVLLKILLIGLFALAIWVLVTMESRVEKKILSEAKKKKISIKEIREPEESDGENPFRETTFWIGASSRIFGMSGERVFNKIVMTNKGKYWVQVKMTFFIPMEVKWEIV